MLLFGCVWVVVVLLLIVGLLLAVTSSRAAEFRKFVETCDGAPVDVACLREAVANDLDVFVTNDDGSGSLLGRVLAGGMQPKQLARLRALGLHHESPVSERCDADPRAQPKAMACLFVALMQETLSLSPEMKNRLERELGRKLPKQKPVLLPMIAERLRADEAYRSTEGLLGTRWGMTLPEVRRVFGHGDAVGREYTVTAELAGTPVTVTFLFSAGRVTQARAVPTAGSFLAPEGQLAFYARLRKLLLEKYGEPSTTEEELVDAPGVSLSDLVASVGLGEAHLRAEWSGDKTAITLRCGQATSGGVLADVTYHSVEFQRAHDRANAAEKVQHLKDL